MNSLYKNIFWSITTLLVIAIVFSMFAETGDKPKPVSIDELVAKLNAGAVEKIIVSGQNVAIELKDGGKATARKEDEAGFTETLKNFGLDPRALQGVAFEIKEESGTRFWLGVLIPTLLPIIVIGIIFWLMFRQAKGGATQAFTFGRANVRLSSPFKNRVTFKDVAGLKEAKQELEEVVDFLKNPKKFLDIGARIPRGVLLMGPPGTGKCVTGDTLIATNKGLVAMQDIPKYFSVDTETNEVFGARVSSIDLEAVRAQENNASHWYDLGEQQTVKIRLRQGTDLEGTPEHPVATIGNDGRLFWKKLSELRLDDVVAMRFNTQNFGALREVDSEQAYAMGLLTGDGNLSHASRVGFTTADEELRDSFTGYVKKRYPEVTLGRASDGITTTVTSWKLKHDLYRSGMSYLLSYDKVIPPSILMAPKEIVVAFLQGLFDTDGYFERYTAGYATVSKTLADQVMALLLNLGIVPRRREKSTVGTSHPRPVYEITISGTSLESFAQRIGFRLRRKQIALEEYLATHDSGNTNIDKFPYIGAFVEDCWQALSAAHKSTDQLARIIDKVRQRKRITRRSLQIMVGAYERSGLRSSAGEYLSALLKAQLFFSPVADIKEGQARVYDFTVPGAHSFVGNGIVNHNTLLARAVSGEAGVPFFHISASEFVEMFVGVGAARTRDAFETAKRAAPSILFIDEIDAIGRERGAGLGGGHDEREQTLNQILVEMDGFERDTKVIVLAATNRPDVLDSALLRPGRFDRRVVLDLPDIADREQILKIHSNNKPMDRMVDLRKIAVRTPGFSGADLANLVNEAAISTARKNKRIISQDELYNSIEKVMLGPERRGRVISAKEKEITAYHEAGHALVAASLKDSDPVHKVSVVSRGTAGGYTLKLPLEEVHLRTRTQFLTDVSVMMGGYVAEQLMFGEMSTGASSDLRQASELARRLVMQYGMSEKLGPQTFGNTQELIFLGREISTEKNYSEAVAEKIDNEVSAFIARAYRSAQKILSSRRKVLETIAKRLLEKEILEQEDFYALLKPFNLKPVAV